MYELLIALKFIKAKKQWFISIVTLFSICGVMLGVMSLVVVLSVMNGFTEELFDKVLGINSHILVMDYHGDMPEYKIVADEVNLVEDVVATTPFIYRQVLAKGYLSSEVAILRGVDPETVCTVLDIQAMITHGNIDTLSELHKGLPGVIIGRVLASKLGLNPGDSMIILSPSENVLNDGLKQMAFYVTAIFDSGMYDYDSALLFMSIENANKLEGRLNINAVTGIEVKVAAPMSADNIALAIFKKIGDSYWVKDWKKTNESLFSMLQMQKKTLSIILSMIILVGAMSIIGTLIMMSIKKRKEIAILRTMGATIASVIKIFLLQGLIIGITGSIAGIVGGLGICYLLSTYRFISLSEDIYLLPSLTASVHPTEVAIIAGLAIVLAVAAALYPAVRTARYNPIEITRYE